MSLLDLIYGLRMHNDLDFQIDKDVARKQYEKERAAAGGLHKQAFAITDKVLEEAEEGKLLPGSGKYGRSYRLRGDLYRYMAKDKSLWYDTLLKCVDNIETNLSPGKGSGGKQVASVVTEPILFDSCPWSFMRADSVRSEVWGRGRLVEVLQDIMRINNTTRNRVISEDIAASPMFLYKDDGSLNPRNINFQPGALLKVRDTGSKNGASIVPLTMPYNQGVVWIMDIIT